MSVILMPESESWGYVFVFHSSRMAPGETSSFCVKDRKTEGEKEVAVNY